MCEIIYFTKIYTLHYIYILAYNKHITLYTVYIWLYRQEKQYLTCSFRLLIHVIHSAKEFMSHKYLKRLTVQTQ